MRLLNSSSRNLESFIETEIPPYAILSHTWGIEEITFDDITGKNGDYHPKKGYNKILGACSLALSNGIKYIWIDTCCIDKSSSSELTEAINSMFKWYVDASVCFVYLSDLLDPPDISDEHPASQPLLRGCRWFTRGWTLQELIAPRNLKFYDSNWVLLGTKHSFAPTLADITGIDIRILQDGSDLTLLYSLPAAQRMSWVAGRQTTRTEDLAYCLLGIFDINLPLIYGEGKKAFIRLQEEIIRQSNDLSIFAWKSKFKGLSGIFANSPSEFEHCGQLSNIQENMENPEFSITNKGIKITTEFITVQNQFDAAGDGDFILPLGCKITGRYSNKKGQAHLGIYLNICGPGVYIRARADELWENYGTGVQRSGAGMERFILKQIPPGSDLNTARKRMLRACFRFPFPFHTPHYQYEATYPPTCWSQDEKVYYRGKNSSSSAMHTFRAKSGDIDHKFALAFGVREVIGGVEEAWVSFVNRQSDPNLFDDAIAGDFNYIDALARLGESTKLRIIDGWEDSTRAPGLVHISIQNFKPRSASFDLMNQGLENSLFHLVTIRHRMDPNINLMYIEIMFR